MSSKNYGKNTCGTPPYVSKIRFENKIKKRKPPKICSDCKETSDSVKLFSNKVNKLEEVIDNFYKNPIKKNKNNQFSIFNAKFTLNNVPCELEYDLSKFSLDNLHKLVIFTTQHCNNNNKYSSSIENIDNESDGK
ncbi:hypothetical protein RhiirA1_429334, partial [Rhizophagus irregularis]|uniref:Uncharacterized protein n=3 Tax=Rhizophagus irregularis TaxID=588596 RepID=A0A015JY35_RHIIW